jgi:hypothetical protein
VVQTAGSLSALVEGIDFDWVRHRTIKRALAKGLIDLFHDHGLVASDHLRSAAAGGGSSVIDASAAARDRARSATAGADDA